MNWMRFVAALAVVAYPVFAQLDSNSLTVTAIRSTALLPDQAVISVSLSTSAPAGLDEVLAALLGTGVTAAGLTGISQDNSSFDLATGPAARWQFTFRSPIAGIQATLASLAAAAAKNRLWNLNFYVQTTEASAKLLAANPCTPADLMTDARARAQKMADAAGLFLGPVLAMSDGGSALTAYTRSYAPAALGVLSAFINTATFISSPASGPACTMTVKFQLLRSQ